MRHKWHRNLSLLTCLLLSACGGRRTPARVEKPLVVIIPSYNNAAWVQNNMSSVLNQRYDNYRVIYLNDCSTDDTYQQVVALVQSRGQHQRVTIINNPVRRGSLANTYHAVHTCADEEIIVILDGDDWFAHDRVLSHLNRWYTRYPIWVTYGSFVNWPTGHRGFCSKIRPAEIAQGRLHQQKFCAGAVRTFYSWLFKNIQKEDLIDQTTHAFYRVAGDVAYMLPLLEMAGEHVRFVQEILCIRNVQTPLNDFKIHRDEQARITREIQHKKPYQRI